MIRSDAQKHNVFTPVIGKSLRMTINGTSISRRTHGKMYFAGSYTDGSSVFGNVPPAG